MLLNTSVYPHVDASQLAEEEEFRTHVTENYRAKQHAHEMDTSRAEADGDESDQRGDAEHHDADSPGEQPRQQAEQAKDDDGECRVVERPDRFEIPVADHPHEHEGDGGSDCDGGEHRDAN